METTIENKDERIQAKTKQFLADGWDGVAAWGLANALVADEDEQAAALQAKKE